MKRLNIVLIIINAMAAIAYILLLHNCYALIGEIDQTLAECDTVLESVDRQEPAGSLYFSNPDDTKLEPERVSLGKFVVTAYCPCEKCCGKWSDTENPKTASGVRPVEGVTVGADWGTLPEGTTIYIEGLGERIVQDRPAKWIIEKYDGKILDLYFENHGDALSFGRQELEVWRIDQSNKEG